MLFLLLSFFVKNLSNKHKKGPVMSSEGLNTLGLDSVSSDRGQVSGFDKDSTDSGEEFSANEPSTSKTLAQHKVFHVH